MAFRPLVSIGGVALPTPSSYIATTSTLVDSGRNAQGYVVGAVIRDNVYKVEMVFNYLEIDTWSSILQLFSSAHGGNFYREVTFWSNLENNWVTKKMYVSDRTTGGLVKVNRETGLPIGVKNCKFSIIEV